MQIWPVYSHDPPPPPRTPGYGVNASLVFLTRSLCLFGDGCGGVALLDTAAGGRGSTTTGGSWQLLEHLPPPSGDGGVGGGAFDVLAGRLSQNGRRLDFITLELGDSPSPAVCDRRGVLPPPACVLRWHRVEFCEDVRALEQQQQQQSPQGGGGGGTGGGGGGGLVESSALCCSLQSQAVPLHCGFFEDAVVIVSEAPVVRIDPVQLDPLPPGQGRDSRSDAEDPEEEVKGHRKRSQEHAGLGYCAEAEGAEEERGGGVAEGGSGQPQTPKRKRLSEETGEEVGRVTDGRTEEEGAPQGVGLAVASVSCEKPYEWSQSDSDLTIAVQLARDVTKHELCCSIESREIVLGLNDGTTFLRGTLHAPVDPEASAWSIEHHR